MISLVNSEKTSNSRNTHKSPEIWCYTAGSEACVVLAFVAVAGRVSWSGAVGRWWWCTHRSHHHGCSLPYFVMLFLRCQPHICTVYLLLWSMTEPHMLSRILYDRISAWVPFISICLQYAMRMCQTLTTLFCIRLNPF